MKKKLDWWQLMDLAEPRLKEVVPAAHAEFLLFVANSHDPWFSETRVVPEKHFIEADVDRLVNWLIERKDQPDFALHTGQHQKKPADRQASRIGR